MSLVTCDRCAIQQMACEFCNYCLDCDFATFEGNSNCPDLECESYDNIHNQGEKEMMDFPHKWKESNPSRGNTECIYCHDTDKEIIATGDINHCEIRERDFIEERPMSSMERKINNQEKWDRRFLDMAKLVSTWSKDPSTKVGAVIVRPDRSVASLGFNGFPMKCGDNPDVYSNREEKLKRVLHAEINAILLARTDVTGYTMYVYPPAVGPSCNRCAVAIIQSGISQVVHYKKQDTDFSSRWTEPCLLGLSLFQEAGVRVVSYEE